MDAVFQRQCWQPWLMKGHAWYATHATWRSSWNRAFPEGIGCCNRNLSSRILPFFDIREDFQSLMNVAKDCRCDMQTQVAQVAMSVSNESVARHTQQVSQVGRGHEASHSTTPW